MINIEFAFVLCIEQMQTVTNLPPLNYCNSGSKENERSC